MPSNMQQGATAVDINTSISYNTRALVRCEASYLGASLPTKTTQPPGIIHEPLEKICEKTDLPTLMSIPKKPVRLYVFHSGIIIELLFGKHSGELVWYPIQNLYCSAGILPCKTKNGQVEFHTLDDEALTKTLLKPLFTMVFREAVKKKVLQCHAFAVARKELAQLLVQATAVAYRDKNGWNHPLSGRYFDNCDYNYTLNIVEEMHADSGYSDHEESSQKSSQSPQSSELSTEIDGKPHLDNPASQTPSSSTTSLATLRESADSQSSTISYLMYERSPSNSGTSVTFSDPQERHSDDEIRDSRSDHQALSVSSGYPMSRDSSTITPLTTRELVNPQRVIVQKPHMSMNGKNSPAKASSPYRSSSVHEFDGTRSPISLDSFNSLKLDQSPRRKKGSKHAKSKTPTTVQAVNFNRVPGTIVQHYEGDYEPYNRSWSNSSLGNNGRYVLYHPEQFMYEGDTYVPNVAYSVPRAETRPQGKERHKLFKESKKKSVKASSTTNLKDTTLTKVDDSMERRLTKKSIPRQLL